MCTMESQQPKVERFSPTLTIIPRRYGGTISNQVTNSNQIIKLLLDSVSAIYVRPLVKNENEPNKQIP